MGCLKLHTEIPPTFALKVSKKEGVFFPSFGMEMETYTADSAGYRYGFNGKEIDKNEEGMGGGGSTYDYGFRIYNPQIGKFLSVDPLAPEYPWNSTYAFAENDVIRCIDLEGLEKYVVVRCWESGKYKGTVCLYLPDEYGVRLYGGNHPSSNKTMVLNLNITDNEMNILRGDIFKKDIASKKISGLKDDVNNILFDMANNSRKKSQEATLIENTPNLNEQKGLETAETRYNNNKFANRLITPVVITMHYNFNESKTVTLNQEQINTYKEYLTNNPGYVIKITGYTDKKGTEAENYKLGLKRAQDLKNFLVSNGIDASRIQVVSKGETEAIVAEESTDAERESDRKITVEWTPNETPAPTTPVTTE